MAGAARALASDDRAGEWRARGSMFTWRPAQSGVAPVEVFHVEAGAKDAPLLLLVHGFPTSSIDWYGVFDRLAERFRVCALDFPGYGFSDKPRAWGYSLERDADLLEHYLVNVVHADRAVVLAHDRGDSVALVLTARCAARRAAVPVEHLVLTNGNVFLPLSQLTDFQRAVLDPLTAPRVLQQVTPEALAQGLGTSTFTPPRTSADPEVVALGTTFAYADGVAVLHETIQYLVERATNEREWLRALAESTIPTTVVWGLYDTVSPPRVATYVWSEFLARRPTPSSLYFVPGANHYLQCDRPDALVDVVFHTLEQSGDRVAGAIAAEPGAPLLVDVSRPQLPSATDVLGARDR
jgi:pimeloyl-ACP methyl ester carboxylesterase